MICVKVPATTANFGAGFDSLGAALDYYNRIWMEEWDGCWIEILDDTDVPTDETNLIYQTAKALYERCGRPFRGLHIRQENRIPTARGLGSSSACIAGGLLGANELLGRPCELAQLVDLAAAMEGHPDNSTPALLGGFVAAAMEGEHVFWAQCPIPEELGFVAVIPDFELKTADARRALPDQYVRADGVYNLSRSALMAISMAQGKLENFYIHDRIPTDATRVSKITTGTYNERMYYQITYKTNYRDYIVLADNLLTSNDYEFSLHSNALGLQNGEYVTDVRLEFPQASPGFTQTKSMRVFCQVLPSLPKDYRITNRADVGGRYGNEWESALTSWNTTVWTNETATPLPKTGY